MRIYLAARYSRRLELCEHRTELEAIGYKVNARWLNGAHQISDTGIPLGDKGEALVEDDDKSTHVKAAALRTKFASEDICDVITSDLLIAFTEPPRSEVSRGGRHVELGIALGCRTQVWIVGHRENIFCWLEEVRFFETWAKCLETLKKGVR